MRQEELLGPQWEEVGFECGELYVISFRFYSGTALEPLLWCFSLDIFRRLSLDEPHRVRRRLIHRSSWKGLSANFAMTEF